MEVVQGLLHSIGQVLAYTWWFWAAFLLFPLLESTWIFWRQEDFKHRYLPWVLLEIRIPRQIEKSYRAMEMVLGGISGMRNQAFDYEEEWLLGEITRWYALEMVSFGGEVHFYVRTYRGQRELMEAAFYAAYPDVELTEVDDYAKDLPSSIGELHERNQEIWGSEMILAKSAAYPLQGHEDFEDFDEKKQFDPMSSFIEILGKAKKDEFVGVQFLIAPAAPDWKEEFEEVIEKLRSKHARGGKEETASLGMEFPHILPTFPVKSGSGEAGESGVVRSYLRTPGETEVLAAIDDNLSQSAFETIVRFIFIAPMETFSDTYPRRGLRFMFNQYGTLDLNYFKENDKMNTRVKIFDFPYILPKLRLLYRQHRILINYRSRQIPEEKWMGKFLTSHVMNWNFHTKWNLLSKRSIASLFHPPTYMVLTGPHLKRVESRKAGAPAGLAIYGEEDQMERYE